MAADDLAKLKIDRTSSRIQRRRWRRWLWLALIGAIILAGGWVASKKWTGAIEVETTAVVTAYPSQSLTVLNSSGYVVAQRKAAVASKATGRLEWLGVSEGSKVKTGEVIARLENKDVTAQVGQADASISVAKANLQEGLAELRDAESSLRRSKELVAKRFISRAAHDTAVTRAAKARAVISSLKAAIEAAQANRNVAQIAVEQTVIRAPFDGVVLTKQANVGDIVTPFSSALDSKGAVVTMADMSTLEVEADVAEASLSKIRVGQPCEILLDAIPDVRLVGVVDRTVPTVDRTKATVLVKIRFVDKDERVLPDMSAKVAFLEREISRESNHPLAAVATQAVVTRGGKSAVFTVESNFASEKSVTTGARLGDLVAVTGVSAGTKVVLNPPATLTNGAKIRIAKK